MKLNKILSLAGLAAAALFAASAASGQIIVSFEETGSGDNLSSEYPINFISNTINGITLTADSNLSTATLSLGSGASAGTAGGSLGFSNAGDDDSLANAISGNNFHSVTLLPSSGFQLNISGLTYNANASNRSSTFVFSVLASPTGFTSSNSLGNFTVTNSSATSGTINLSGESSLQGLTSSTELRIYVHRTIGSGTSAYYADDGLNNGLFSINGSVTAVPEPSTYAAILGLLVLGFVAYRRRNLK